MQTLKIVGDEKVTINGVPCRQITYSNGESVIKKYSEKYKTHVTLKFSKEDDPNAISKVREIATLSIVV